MFSPPWGLVLTVAIVLAVEAFVVGESSTDVLSDLRQQAFYRLDRLPAFEESVVQWQVDFCRRNRQPQDVLLLGDSSCLMGLRPRRIMQRTDLSAWDVGTLSLVQIEGHREILDTYIENHGLPRLIVYHVAPAPFLFSFDSPGEYLIRLKAYLHPESLPSPWLPSLVYRRTIRNRPIFQSMKDDLLRARRGVFPSDVEVRQILLQRRGALTERRLREWAEPLDMEFSFPPYVVDSLRKLFAFSAEHGCRVLLMVNPLPERARTPENVASLDHLTANLRRVTEEFPNVELFDPLIRFYPNDLCFSAEHVYEEGAERNTDELIDWIEQNQLVDRGGGALRPEAP